MEPQNINNINNNRKTAKAKQRNQLSLPCKDYCKTRKVLEYKYCILKERPTQNLHK